MVGLCDDVVFKGGSLELLDSLPFPPRPRRKIPPFIVGDEFLDSTVDETVLILVNSLSELLRGRDDGVSEVC